MRPLTTVCIQSSAGSEHGVNMDRAVRALTASAGCDLAVLPEVFGFRGLDAQCRALAEPVPGPTVERIARIAAELRCWILAGSIAERDGARVFNTSVLLDRRGAIAAVYRKIHLFSATLSDGSAIREQDVYAAGSAPVLADVEGWRCGLAICYDLRFPELFRRYADAGAHLLLVPSNFTHRTGSAHWDVLVRARAIENQAFVVAANQCGSNPATGVRSYGHSMIVNPWGEVLCAAGEDEDALTATLDPECLRRTRAALPALEHRVLT